jgi:hypothetical protein
MSPFRKVIIEGVILEDVGRIALAAFLPCDVHRESHDSALRAVNARTADAMALP